MKRDNRPKEVVVVAPSSQPESSAEPMEMVEKEEPITPPASSAAAPLKKKKKMGYKAVMNSMMKEKKVDVEAERQKLANGLGGGSFSKIEKI